MVRVDAIVQCAMASTRTIVHGPYWIYIWGQEAWPTLTRGMRGIVTSSPRRVYTCPTFQTVLMMIKTQPNRCRLGRLAFCAFVSLCVITMPQVSGRPLL